MRVTFAVLLLVELLAVAIAGVIPDAEMLENEGHAIQKRDTHACQDKENGPCSVKAGSAQICCQNLNLKCEGVSTVDSKGTCQKQGCLGKPSAGSPCNKAKGCCGGTICIQRTCNKGEYTCQPSNYKCIKAVDTCLPVGTKCQAADKCCSIDNKEKYCDLTTTGKCQKGLFDA